VERPGSVAAAGEVPTRPREAGGWGRQGPPGHGVETFGRLDISIANAGIVHHADFLNVKVEDFNRVMTVNVTGAFLTGQKAAQQMIKCGNGGSIINIASTNAVVVNLGQVPYAASKGGIVLLTKVMAVSLADYGIRVNAIGPGSVRTPMFDDVVERMPGMEDMILSRTPMRRISLRVSLRNGEYRSL